MADVGQDLVVRTIRAHADSLLRLARRHSLCADDANDAYQRGLEIFLRRAATLDPERAPSWLRTVVKHEAMAVRASRQRLLGTEEADLDSHEASHLPSPEEQLLAFDTVSRSAEALQRLKPQELRALWLKAAGNSYAEIAETTGWSYTKVNRCISEGRRSFLDRYASIERGEECERWAPVVSAIIDGEATADQVVAARPHLRNCPACRATAREAQRQSTAIAALMPIGVTVGAGHVADGHAGVLTRAYEAIAGAFHERTISFALKAQAALDTASAAKVAAVAASAAAFAGGGMVVADRAADGGHGPHRSQLVAEHDTVASGHSGLATPLGPVRGAAKHAPHGARARSDEFGRATRSPRLADEFDVRSRAASTAAEPVPPSNTAPATGYRSGAEFGP